MKSDQIPITESDGDDIKEESDSLDGKHYHRSEASSDKNGFFHRVKHHHKGIKQVTNVNVKIEQHTDDGCSGCFKAIISCLKR